MRLCTLNLGVATGGSLTKIKEGTQNSGFLSFRVCVIGREFAEHARFYRGFRSISVIVLDKNISIKIGVCLRGNGPMISEQINTIKL